MDRPPARTLLEVLIRQSQRTLQENCAEFDRTADRLDEKTSLSPRQLSRWMAGRVDSARPVMQRVAEQHWGYSFKELLGPPSLALVGKAVRGQVNLEEPPHNIFDQLEAAALMAAFESSQHAASVGGGVDPMSIEQVQSSVYRLARRFHEMPPIRLLAEARKTRDLAYLLLEKTRRPAQTKDLYLAAGQACGLMALASFDLAIWDAAEDQARAAHTYAELVDHSGLRAWSRGTQALIAYWTGQPRRAVDLTQAGLEEAPTGAATARLHGIQARAWSHLGNAQAVTAGLGLADQAMDEATGNDDLLDSVGGEFGWGMSLHSACAGTALLGVGDAVGAARRIRAALAVLSTDPYGGLVPERACIDLAAAELAAGRFEAVVVALDSVWAIPVAQRRHGLTGRLDSMARALTAPRWHGTQEAVDLRDRIEAFNAEAANQRALPAA